MMEPMDRFDKESIERLRGYGLSHLETANMAKERVDSSLLYEAANLLNQASDKFAAIVEKEPTQQE